MFKTVLILILEHASLYHASQSKPTIDKAVDWAYSQYCTSDIHNKVITQFFMGPKEYSILQFVEFILKHCL
jgi:hypothetical protein